MDINLLKQVVAVFENSTAAMMELETEDIKIKLKKPPAAATTAVPPAMPAVTPAATEKVNGEYIKSPLVGTFYAAPSADSEPFVKIGQHVDEGDILCIIEAMKVMNEIKAAKSGWITDIKVKNGQTVAYDDELIAIGDTYDL